MQPYEALYALFWAQVNNAAVTTFLIWQVNNAAVAILAAGCRSLQSLDLGWCEVGDEALQALARHCPHLATVPSPLGPPWHRHRHRHRPSLRTRPAPAPNPDPGPDSVCACFGGRVGGWGSSFLLWQVSLAYCDQTTFLIWQVNLAYCDQITDVGIAALCKGCVELASLDLGGCNRLSEAALVS